MNLINFLNTEMWKASVMLSQKAPDGGRKGAVGDWKKIDNGGQNNFAEVQIVVEEPWDGQSVENKVKSKSRHGFMEI